MAGQLWVTNSLGGFMSANKLSNVLRTAVQPLAKFRQFCDARDFTDKGLHKGQVFTWNVYNNIATQGTVLTETATVPETNFTITQGTGTVVELGNSVPYTGMLDNLSEHPVTEIVTKVLKDDCRKALDLQAYNQFNATKLRVAATGGTDTTLLTLTTNGTCSTSNNVALGKNHIKGIVDVMKERNIPPYANDEYFGIAHPTTWRGVKNDLEAVYQYRDEGFGMIYNGEIGKYEGVRFIEQNSIAKETWGGAKSNFAFFFGEDTVAEAIVVPEEVRGKIPSDYGRSKGIAWYYLGGFAIVQTQAQEARIVKWDTNS
jgi:N4-gp56 family major capsid protein